MGRRKHVNPVWISEKQDGKGSDWDKAESLEAVHSEQISVGPEAKYIRTRTAEEPRSSSFFLSERLRHEIAACFCVRQGFSRHQIRHFVSTANLIHPGYADLNYQVIEQLLKEQLTNFEYSEKYFCQICYKQLRSFTSCCPKKCKNNKKKAKRRILPPMVVASCSIRLQLCRILSMHYAAIWKNLDKIKGDELSELVTFPAYRKGLKFGENPTFDEFGNKILEISIIFSSDGIEITERSKTKVWVNGGVIIELPTHLRESESCALVFTVSSSADNPTLGSQNLCLDQFVDEALHLQNHPFLVSMGHETVRVYVVIKLCVSDSPAKNQVFLHRSWKAPYGCPLCLVKGEQRGRRKIYWPNKCELRTPEGHRKAAEEAEKLRKERPDLGLDSTSVLGVAGKSRLLDLMSITSVLVDFFHVACEGLSKMFRKRCLGESRERATGSVPGWSLRRSFSSILDLLSEIRFPPNFPRNISNLEFAKWTGSGSLDFFCFLLLPLISFFPPNDPNCFFMISIFVTAFRLPRHASFSDEIFDEYEELLETMKLAVDALNIADLTYNFHQFTEHTAMYFRQVGSPVDVSSSSMEKNYGLWKQLISKNTSRNLGSIITRRIFQLKGFQLSIVETPAAMDNPQLSHFANSVGGIRKNWAPDEGVLHPSLPDSKPLLVPEMAAIRAAGVRMGRKRIQFYRKISVNGLAYSVKSERPQSLLSRCLTVFTDSSDELQIGLISRILTVTNAVTEGGQCSPMILLIPFQKSCSLSDSVPPPNNQALRSYFAKPRRSYFFIGDWSDNFMLVEASKLEGYAMQLCHNGVTVAVDCRSRYLTT